MRAYFFAFKRVEGVWIFVKKSEHLLFYAKTFHVDKAQRYGMMKKSEVDLNNGRNRSFTHE